MATQIRPNRLEVSDRFPMLGFTVRTDGTAKRYEIAIATSPDLFGPDGKTHRSRSNFYSTRATGPLPIERGESVYVLPAEVLARFVGQQKLYYGLAMIGNGSGSGEVVTMPGAGSPYINLSGLTGRSLQRVRLLPNRQRAAANYGRSGMEMEWAGDVLTPGTQPAAPAVAKNGGKTASSSTAPIHYDDGYGPLPQMPAPPTDSKPQPQTKSLADDAAESEDSIHGIGGPIPDGDATAQSLANGTSAEYPQASRFAPAASVNYRTVSGTRTINQVVIHITDGGSKINGTIGWFQNPDQRNAKGDPIHVSAHYVVGQDGEVVQMVKHNDVAWHASSANSDSIGIEHVARSPRAFGQSDSGLMPTDAQYCASAALVNWLCSQFNIPMDRDHIRGHNEASPRDHHTGCPNAVWDWDSYMGLVTSGTCQPSSATASSLGMAGRDPGTRKRSSMVQAKALRQVDAGYSPGNAQEALQYQKQFQDRKQTWAAGVQDTTFFPHSAICKLRMTIDGRSFSGTGFYIGDDRILTCGHNLAGASSVTITPGKNDDTEPFGSFTVSPSDWVIHPKFDVTVARSSATGHDFDLAVIKVSTPPPNGQAFGILEELLQCQDSPIIVCGYAGETVDKNKQHLDGDAIRLLNDSSEVFMYNLQTEGGTSGSPVYYVTVREDDERQQSVLETRLIGVHVDFVQGSNILNEGCRLTADKIAWINSIGKPFSAGAAAFSVGKDTKPQTHDWKKHHHRPSGDGKQYQPQKVAAQALDADMQPVHLPQATAVTGWKKQVIRGAIEAMVAAGMPPVSTVLPMLIRFVNEKGVSVGIGLGGDAGLLGGAGLGFGIILAPNDDVGIFGDVEISVGLLAGLSAGARVIVVHGGIDAFNATSYALGVTIEEGPSISAIALFNEQREFHGVSFQLGVGAALSPIQIFGGVEKSISKAVTQSLAAAGAGSSTYTPVRAQAAQPSTTSGIGVAEDARPYLKCILGQTEQGRAISFVQRYLRNLTPGEVTALSDAGLPIVSCFEVGRPTNAAYFTRVQGQRDGRAGFTQAQALGQPGDTPIYFAVDFDPAPGQRQVILDYFQGVQEGCAQYLADMQAQGTPGVIYAVGVYGSGCVLDWCQAQGIATYFWQAFAPGWCNNRQVWEAANLHTWRLDHPATCGTSLDHVEGWGNEGGWTAAAAAAQGQALSLHFPAAPARRSYSQGQGADSTPRMIANSPITTVTGGEGNVTWDLDQFSGVKMASVSAVAPMQSAETIQLSHWPYCDHTNGDRTCAWFSVDWKFSGQSLGQIRITPSGTQQGPYPLRVEARIEEGKNRDATTISLAVRFTYHFSNAQGPEVVAVTDLILYSDGSIEQNSNWMSQVAA